MTDKDTYARVQNERWEAICGALTGDMEPDDEYGDIAVGRAVFGEAIDAAYQAAHAAAIEAAAGVDVKPRYGVAPGGEGVTSWDRGFLAGVSLLKRKIRALAEKGGGDG